MNIINDHSMIKNYKTKVIRSLIDFKWSIYGSHIHYLSALIHLFYVIIFLIYVNQVYLNLDATHKTGLLWTMLVCHIYAALYEFR